MARSARKDPHTFPHSMDVPIGEARRWLRGVIEDGAVCPCCGQLARVSKRKLDASISASLVLIYRYALAHPHEPWVHVPTLLASFPELARSGGHYGKGAHWGLLESRMDVEGEGLGWHRPTDRGVAFVEGSILVPEYVWCYDNQKFDEGGKLISIRESLSTQYNYEQLMGL